MNEILVRQPCSEEGCTHLSDLKMAASTMDVARGVFSDICKCCAIKKWIAGAEVTVKRLEHWRTQVDQPCAEIRLDPPDAP